MFIQTQQTPNPNTIKFYPGKILTKGEIIEFKKGDPAAAKSILASQLFNIPSITNIMIHIDYIAISKENAEWQHIKPEIMEILISYFLHNEQPLMSITGEPSKPSEETEEFFDEADKAIVEAIKELIESHVRPAVTRDGGDIKFRGYKEGVVYLTMHGACSGCPSANLTLKQGVENLLKHFLPQIKSVENFL